MPSAHPYVQAVTDRRLVDLAPDPPVPGATDGRWWPPVALTAPWIDDNAARLDVLHVHFGLESSAPDDLVVALTAARKRGLAVVYTVHDLDNPQLTDQSPYLALLDVIIPAADRLVTLTADAASEVERRWGRTCEVLPHPLLTADSGESGVPAPSDPAPRRVGLHLRDLRPNIDAAAAVAVAVAAADLLATAGTPVLFDILLNERVRDAELAARLQAIAASHPSVQLRRTPRMTDAAIEAWLAGLDLFVLPYRHGTHSGWVELCFDLGVPVAGTPVGHVAAQHPSSFATLDLDDPSTLVDAVHQARAARQAADRPTVRQERRRARMRERDEVRAAHAALYREAMEDARARRAGELSRVGEGRR